MHLSIPKLFSTLVAGAMFVSLAGADAPPAPAQPQPDKDGFISLFDGKTLDGWKVGANPQSWSVEDGHITCHGPGPSHLFYEGPIHDHDWKNIDLKVELMTFPHANSGVYFDTKYQEKGFPNQGFECQVNCTHKDWKKTGSLYDIVDIKDPHHKDNEWFLYEIIVKGDHVVLKVNNETVCDWTQPADFKPPKNHPGRFIQHGTIALQGHDPGSQTYFRSIKIKALDD